MWESILNDLPRIITGLIMMVVVGQHLVFTIPKSIEKTNKKLIAEGKPSMTDAEIKEKTKKDGIISWITMMIVFLVVSLIIAALW